VGISLQFCLEEFRQVSMFRRGCLEIISPNPNSIYIFVLARTTLNIIIVDKHNQAGAVKPSAIINNRHIFVCYFFLGGGYIF
jgi:hypothetical protein